MDDLNKITGRGNNVSQLLMGEEWDQDLEEDYGDYISTLMDFIRSSS